MQASLICFVLISDLRTAHSDVAPVHYLSSWALYFRVTAQWLKPALAVTSRCILLNAFLLVTSLGTSHAFGVRNAIWYLLISISTCSRANCSVQVLSLKGFATIAGDPYCKPHYMETFKSKGNYKASIPAPPVFLEHFLIGE